MELYIIHESHIQFVKWKWPDTHGEDKYVVMFGGLHIEMAMWKTYGDYLEVSGCTTALTEAGIASSGTADSFLKASHLTRTSHAHQVSVLALAKLQQDAFLDMVNEEPHDEKTRKAWIQESNIPVLEHNPQHGHSGSDICASPQRTGFCPLCGVAEGSGPVVLFS
jgi:hypothetical protein